MDKERVAPGRRAVIEGYQQRIVDTLEGKIPELRNIPRERLDWNGTCVFFSWYGGLSGKDRDSAIKAIGRIIEDSREDPATIAEVVDLATSLDLTQLEPQVKKLQKSPIVKIEFVKEAIDGFFAPIELNRYIQEKVQQGELP